MTRSTWESIAPKELRETEGFLETPGGTLSVVSHSPSSKARSRVLLCGPFGLERTFAYTTWKRLARTLAESGFQALTFDYVGSGESGGEHQDLTGKSCNANVLDLAKVISEDETPLILVGLRAGALFAANAFHLGVGDGLLLLDPPLNLRTHLREVLRRKLAEDFADRGKKGPKLTRDSYVETLRDKGVLEIEGHYWSRALYDDSHNIVLHLPKANDRPKADDGPKENDARAIHVVHFDKRPLARYLVPGKTTVNPISRPPFWGSDPILRGDHSDWFETVRKFVDEVATQSVGSKKRLDAERSDADRSQLHLDAGLSRLRLNTGLLKRAVDVKVKVEPRGAQQSIVRSVFKIDVDERWVGATAHSPKGLPAGSDQEGLLLLNAGQVPREGHGRLSVELADALAATGVLVVRVDLPGLGDSPGALPKRCDTHWRFVEGGGHVPVTIQVLEALKRKYDGQKWVIGGLCGAAINAMYCGAQRPDLVNGLLLLEPELFVVETAEGSDSSDSSRDEDQTRPQREQPRWARVLQQLRSTESWLRIVTGDSRLGPKLKVFGKILLPFLLSRAPLPDNLNRPLAIALAKTIEERIPTLTITAQGQLREIYLDKTLRAFAPTLHPTFEWTRLADTNHVFTAGHAKERVVENVRQWIGSLAAPANKIDRAA